MRPPDPPSYAPYQWPDNRQKPSPAPRRLPIIAVALSGLAVVALVTSFLVVFQLARGGEANRVNTGPAMGTLTPADVSPSAQPEGTATLAPSPTAALRQGVRITQNQDMRPLCVEETAPYTVKLTNAGSSAATWSVVFPVAPTVAQPAELIARSPSSPMFPRAPGAGSPVWGVATPSSGAVGPGRSASFSINVLWAMPCGGTTYHASMKVGGQADLPLTYAGTGAARFSNIVVTQNEQYTQTCPSGVAPPPPYIVTIKNTGNYRAYIYFLAAEQTPLGVWWAIPMADPSSSWIEANGTMTITMTPQSWISCNGTTYNMRLMANTGQGTRQDINLTDTVN